MMHISQLEEQLREIVAQACHGADAAQEKELLRAALEISEEWQDRIDEIEEAEEPTE